MWMQGCVWPCLPCFFERTCASRITTESSFFFALLLAESKVIVVVMHALTCGKSCWKWCTCVKNVRGCLVLFDALFFDGMVRFEIWVRRTEMSVRDGGTKLWSVAVGSEIEIETARAYRARVHAHGTFRCFHRNEATRVFTFFVDLFYLFIYFYLYFFAASRKREGISQFKRTWNNTKRGNGTVMVVELFGV